MQQLEADTEKLRILKEEKIKEAMGELLAAQEKQKLKEAKDAAAELRKELNKPMSLSQVLNVCEQRLCRQYMMDNRSDTAQKVWDIITGVVNDEGDKDAGAGCGRPSGLRRCSRTGLGKKRRSTPSCCGTSTG